MFMSSEQLLMSVNGLRKYASAIDSWIEELSCIFLDIGAKHVLDRILLVLKYNCLCGESVPFGVSGYSHILGLEFSRLYHTLCIIQESQWTRLELRMYQDYGLRYDTM